MRIFGYTWPRALAQLRNVVDRAALGLLVGLSVLLLVLGKADVKLAGYIAERIGDVAAPVLAFVNQPLVAVRGGLDHVGELLAVYDENTRLREENRRLLAWQAEAARLSVQNRALREMLNVPPLEAAPAWTISASSWPSMTRTSACARRTGACSPGRRKPRGSRFRTEPCARC